MFMKNLELSTRQLLKNRLFSMINIMGLAIGLAACTMIALFVQFEFSFDQHWAKSERLYNVHPVWKLPSGWEGTSEEAPAPWKGALDKYFKEEIAASTRTIEASPFIKVGDQVSEQQVIWTDVETADMFNFDVVAGSVRQVLSDKRSIALSEAVAQRLFGSATAMGQVMTITRSGRDMEYRVGAVYRDLENRSVLNFPAFVLIDEADFAPANSGRVSRLDRWDDVTARVYFELKEGVPVGTVTSRLNGMLDSLANRLHFGSTTLTPSQIQNPAVLPLSTMRLKGPTGGTGGNVAIFTAIAILILVIAAINFINLSTAKSGIRAKEVGLRKVLGASRGSLVQQYLTESLFTAVIAATISLMLVEIFLPVYNDVALLDLQLDYSNTPLVALFIGTTLFVGLFAGLYPAFVLSSFRPGQVLKANRSVETIGSSRLRSLLVVLQFAISITLIVAALVVYLQRLYTANLDPGFNKTNLLIIENMNRSGAAEVQKAFQQQVEKLPRITGSTFTTNAPTVYRTGATSVKAPSVDPDKALTLFMNFHDHKYFSLFEVPILAGRDFSPKFSEDLLPGFGELRQVGSLARNVVINALAAKRLGLGSPEDAVGSTLTARLVGADLTLRVVGVAGNAYFRGVRKEAQPRIFFQADRALPLLTLRYTGDAALLISEIERLWTTMVPNIPFKYTYVEQALAAEFNGEKQTNLTLAIYAGLAILIACLGLYGLASFSAERRVREIGLRKVLGASVWDIVRLLIWQFSRPVLVANLVAWPVVVYLMNDWLNGFPVRIELWVLLPLCLAAGVISIAIAWGTVGSNAFVVARKTPIHALRYE
ncbi:MAG: hypothetical protein COB37_00395 [Kordiimonadales bacterium]|nr:MAG: hypothetical protein COB37_00395 [Kordiimonadales bacterium]